MLISLSHDHVYMTILLYHHIINIILSILYYQTVGYHSVEYPYLKLCSRECEEPKKVVTPPDRFHPYLKVPSIKKVYMYDLYVQANAVRD